MRSDPARYRLLPARTLEEALGLLAAEPGALRPLAGGTDVMVLMAAGHLGHPGWINIWGLRELRGIEVTAEHILLPSLTSYREVQAHPTVRSELPMLCQAASETGGWAIQNRGTLGGNIANASPAADSCPALLAYGAEIELVAQAGSRWVDYAAFHTGYKKTVMRPDELIGRIRVPRPRGRRADFYRKVGPRRAQAISKICFASSAEDGVVRIALGGVAPTVIRCPQTEKALAAGDLAAAQAALAAEIAPIDDVRSSARYRARVAQNLLVELAGAIR